MAKLSDKINSIKSESRPSAITPFRLGAILEETNVSKVSYFKTTSDPTLNPNLDVKEGDIWFYPIAPFMKYERIDGVWIDFNSYIAGSDFRPDGIF